MPKPKFTDEQFIELVKSRTCHTYAELARAMGLTTMKHIKHRITKLNLTFETKNHSHYINDDVFIETVKSSQTIREVLIKLDLTPFSGSYDIFHNRVKKLNLDISHFIKKIGRPQKDIRKAITDEQIINACKTHMSRRSVLILFNLTPETNVNVQWMNKKIKTLSIDTNHWTGQAHLKGKAHNYGKTTPLSDLLIENSSIPSSQLKERLLNAGIFTYKCLFCDLSEWQNKKITLQLDHINGNHFDNRLENLRLLCPNCHSQTDTFCRPKKLNGDFSQNK